MDLDFTEEQETLREMVRRVCNEHTPLDVVRAMESDPTAELIRVNEDNRRDRIFTPEEEVALLAECSPLVRRIIRFAVATGFRPNEYLDLRWEHIDVATIEQSPNLAFSTSDGRR